MQQQIIYIFIALIIIGSLLGLGIRLNKKQDDDILNRL